VKIGDLRFGSITIEGRVYDCDVVIERGEVHKRKKKPSKKYREQFGHTPVSLDERIPWKCQRLVIGTGKYGSLPVMEEVRREADRRGVELVILPTDEAARMLADSAGNTSAILHVTC
jgi:hypothetical protein